jgi:molybdenum cofactor guanylyltransferase
MNGAILAGGRSSRFGSDKALHVWRGQTLLLWAKQGLAGCQNITVIGGQENPDPKPHLGALAGLVRALETGGERVAVTACDMPNLTPDYWQHLASYQADVVICTNPDGLLEPLAAIYSQHCLPHARAALADGKLKLSDWWLKTGLTTQILAWDDLEPVFGKYLFLNANHLEDLP